MADIVESIREFVKDTYEIKASITGDLCIIEFPFRSQVPASRYFRTCYEIEYEGDTSRLKYTRWSDKNKILRDVVYSLPNYATKMFIWCDLVRCSLMLGYSYEMIRYELDGEEVDEEGFFKCLPTPLYDSEFEEKQEKLENLFIESYDKIYSDFEEQAEMDGVGDGFRLVCNIFLEAK